MATNKLTRTQFRLLGFLPLAFFTAQAIHYWQINQLGQMLWMCNIGNLLLALGLFFEQALLIRVAVIWTVPGLAIWFVYVLPTWGLLLSSTLVHVGGICVGLIAIRNVGMDRRAWFYAFIWYFVVQLLSRLVTPAAMNVNVSNNIQAGWEQTFSSYWKFWLVLTILVGICLWAIGLMLRSFWPPTTAASVENVPTPWS